MSAKDASRPKFSLRNLLGLTLVLAMAFGWWTSALRLREAQQELETLRIEVGYLPPTEPNQVAAVRLTSDEPLTYRMRVRVPEKTTYRASYSSVWPKSTAKPDWFASTPVPSGESLVLVRIARDPRDDQWKITTLVRSESGVQRVATVLPDDHAKVFQGSYDALSTGIGKKATIVNAGQSIRILDERWLVGEGALMLYGDRPPERDQIGIYAELQPADQAL